MTLTDQKKQALELYVNQSYTQQKIADAVGVTVRTVHNWVKQHAWDRLISLYSIQKQTKSSTYISD